MATKSKFVRKLTTLTAVSAGAAVVFTGLNIYKGSERFYNDVLMPIVVKTIPPETSHQLAVWACKYKLFPEQNRPDPDTLSTRFFTHNLSNPIGIAAGFDKQGEAVEGLEKIGFGLIEIGSVTPNPQPGNDKPRVFRLVEDEAIINRYGFNSEGHEKVYLRLKELRERRSLRGVLGINLGKNKTSDSALSDYVQGVKLFGPIADYLVINVSSPNTPGLRDLQGKKDLENLLSGVIEARNHLQGASSKVPVFLKLAPDLTKQDIKDIASVISKTSCKVDGLIVSNTTIDKSDLKNTEHASEAGGLSGQPLKTKSTQLIADMYHITGGKVPIIGVGGIASGADAFEKLQAGASYLQFYTAFIYHGPPIVQRVKDELDAILKEKGFKNAHDAVGKGYKQFLSGN